MRFRASLASLKYSARVSLSVASSHTAAQTEEIGVAFSGGVRPCGPTGPEERAIAVQVSLGAPGRANVGTERRGCRRREC